MAHRSVLEMIEDVKKENAELIGKLAFAVEALQSIEQTAGRFSPELIRTRAGKAIEAMGNIQGKQAYGSLGFSGIKAVSLAESGLPEGGQTVAGYFVWRKVK